MAPTRPPPHRALVEVDLAVCEVGHLLEGVYGDEHGANVGLGWRWLREIQFKQAEIHYVELSDIGSYKIFIVDSPTPPYSVSELS